MVSPNIAASRHSAGSCRRRSSQPIPFSKYRSATTVESSSEAASVSGAPPISGHSVNIAVARHGRSRPRPPPASSTSPYFASWRRWNEQLAALSPISSLARVAVSGPLRRRRPISSRRMGWATARSARGSVSLMVRRGAVRFRVTWERYQKKAFKSFLVTSSLTNRASTFPPGGWKTRRSAVFGGASEPVLAGPGGLLAPGPLHDPRGEALAGGRGGGERARHHAAPAGHHEDGPGAVEEPDDAIGDLPRFEHHPRP